MIVAVIWDAQPPEREDPHWLKAYDRAGEESVQPVRNPGPKILLNE